MWFHLHMTHAYAFVYTNVLINVEQRYLHVDNCPVCASADGFMCKACICISTAMYLCVCVHI